MKHTAFTAGIDGINVTTYTDDATEHNVETVPYDDMIKRVMDGDFDYDPRHAIGILQVVMKAEMTGLKHCNLEQAVAITRYIVAATYAEQHAKVPREMLPEEVLANEPAGAHSYLFNLEFDKRQTAMTLRTLRNATEIMVDENVIPPAAEKVGKEIAMIGLLKFYGTMITEDDDHNFTMTEVGNNVMAAVVNGIIAKTQAMKEQQERDQFAADLDQPHTLH